MKYLKFPLNPLLWMVGVTSVYLMAAALNLVFKFTSIETIQMIWVCILALPIYFPLQRLIDMDPFWKKP